MLCEEPENRGKLVAAGGGKVTGSAFNNLVKFEINIFCSNKALIPLATSGTEIGKARAGQALAKMAISINPELAFPGQRVKLNLTGCS